MKAQSPQRTTRRTTVLLTGLPYFVRQLVEITFVSPEWRVLRPMLDAGEEYRKKRLKRLFILFNAIRRADVWYQIGGYLRRGTISRIARLMGVPMVVHWAGSDVLRAAQYAKANPRFAKMAASLVHWAGAPWLVEELRAIGIESSFVPLPLKSVGQALSRSPVALPSQFTILSYLPYEKHQFYGSNHIIQLGEDFPDAQILVVGSDGLPLPAGKSLSSNIRFLGWVNDMYDVYSGSTVVVRMTQHDGYGGTIQEALAMGRYGVWTYPFPGAREAKDYPALRHHVEQLFDLHEKGLLPINEEGRDYMRHAMNPQRLSERITEGLRQILQKRK